MGVAVGSEVAGATGVLVRSRRGVRGGSGVRVGQSTRGVIVGAGVKVDHTTTVGRGVLVGGVVAVAGARVGTALVVVGVGHQGVGVGVFSPAPPPPPGVIGGMTIVGTTMVGT